MVADILKPNFETRLRKTLYFRKGKSLPNPEDKIVSVGTIVHVAYHSIPIHIKIDKILSETEYVGTIVKVEHNPDEKVNLSIGIQVYFLKKHIVLIET